MRGFKWLSYTEAITIEVGDAPVARSLRGGAGQADWGGHIPIQKRGHPIRRPGHAKKRIVAKRKGGCQRRGLYDEKGEDEAPTTTNPLK